MRMASKRIIPSGALVAEFMLIAGSFSGPTALVATTRHIWALESVLALRKNEPILAGITIVLDSCEISGNNASKGAGIGRDPSYWVSTVDAYILMYDCVLHSNRADVVSEYNPSYGGAVFVPRRSSMQLHIGLFNCEIHHNIARIGGGGMFIDDAADRSLNITMVATDIFDNVALEGAGGGIFGGSVDPRLCPCFDEQLHHLQQHSAHRRRWDENFRRFHACWCRSLRQRRPGCSG